MFVAVFTKSNLSVYVLWNDHYYISSSLIGSLHALMCIFFLFNWIFLAGMLFYVFKKLLLCMILKWLLLYIQFIDFLFTCLDLYVVSFYLNYCSEYGICCLTTNDFFVWLWNIIFMLYQVHWLILYLLVSVYCFFSFELL